MSVFWSIPAILGVASDIPTKLIKSFYLFLPTIGKIHLDLWSKLMTGIWYSGVGNMSYIQFNKAQVVAILLKFHLHPSSINEQQRLGAQQKQGLTVHVERVFFRQVGFKLASSWLHDMQHTVPGTSYLRYFTNLILAAKQAIFCVCFFFLPKENK